MSTAGDSAEQVVRMSLEGVEAVAKISGKGAMEIAKLLLAEMKKPQRTKGRASLMTMLRQGKPIKIFEIGDRSLKKFCEEARKYGVMYHVLKDKTRNDGKCDIMVRAEDVSKINRIIDRFDLSVDRKASIRSSVVRGKDGRQDTPEKQRPEKSPEDIFIEELFKKPMRTEKTQNDNPTTAKTERSHPSEPSSKSRGDPRLSRDGSPERPSVRKQLRDLERQRRRTDKSAPTRPARNPHNKKGSRNHGRT